MRERVGVNMSWLTTIAPQYDSFVTIPPGQQAAARTCRRLYTAIVIREIINEVLLCVAYVALVFLRVVKAQEGGTGL